jgi:hypothetical protein
MFVTPIALQLHARADQSSGRWSVLGHLMTPRPIAEPEYWAWFWGRLGVSAWLVGVFGSLALWLW